MFLLSVLAVILVIGFSAIFSGNGVGVRLLIMLLDIPSLIILLMVIIPALMQTGLLKDFNNGFRLTIGKKSKGSFKEIKRAIAAIQLVRKCAVYAAVFSVCISFVIIMTQLSDPAALGPNLAVAVLSVLYAALINIIFLPMEKQLEVKLIEFAEEVTEVLEVEGKEIEGVEEKTDRVEKRG